MPHTNITSLDMPLSVAYELTTYDCANNSGPKIYFCGSAGTVGFGVRTILRNNDMGTHEYTNATNVDVLCSLMDRRSPFRSNRFWEAREEIPTS